MLSGWLVAGLYRGAGITLLRDVPAHAIYFTSYEACHELFAPGSRASGEQTALVQLLGGGLAGVLSWLGIYHFDVVKTRLQSQPRASSSYSGASCFACFGLSPSVSTLSAAAAVRLHTFVVGFNRGVL